MNNSAGNQRLSVQYRRLSFYWEINFLAIFKLSEKKFTVLGNVAE